MLTRLAYDLWLAAAHPNWRRFRRDLARPSEIQQKLLARYVADNGGTEFGREHQFGAIQSVSEFRQHVPIRSYDGFLPYIERIVDGVSSVLTEAPVRLFEPSSGTAAARKLIPYTRRLQREFARGVDAWVYELYQTRPQLRDGPSYWSISPALTHVKRTPGGVPIGFEEDSAYLGGVQQALVRRVMAVPSAVRHVMEVDVFRYVTLLHLVRQRNLSLISVWHPSFLDLLLDALPAAFDRIRQDIARGTLAVPLTPAIRAALRVPPDPERAAEITTPDWRSIWPHLGLVSCWADGPARLAAAALKRRLQGVEMQPKGLLATEGFITLPFEGRHVLAVRSHFFEFVDEAGQAWMADEVQEGYEYTVLLTTGGGLYRYDLQDRIRVTGFIGRTPCLEFIGKAGKVSDLRGEKLHEAFVSDCLGGVLPEYAATFAMLAPDNGGYTLYLEASEPPAHLAAALESTLARNFHYQYAVSLGQLRPVRLFLIAHGARAAYETRCMGLGQRLGDIKPVALHTRDGWSAHFIGQYL